MVFVSKHKDDFLKERYEWEAYWKVVLSNDEIIYQDDDRPNVTPHSSWQRLAAYVAAHGLSIKNMTLHYRSIKRNIGADVEGYFFCKSALRGLNSPETEHFYLCGTLNKDILLVKRWKIPGLTLENKEKRDPKKAENCLIRNII